MVVDWRSQTWKRRFWHEPIGAQMAELRNEAKQQGHAHLNLATPTSILVLFHILTKTSRLRDEYQPSTAHAHSATCLCSAIRRNERLNQSPANHQALHSSILPASLLHNQHTRLLPVNRHNSPSPRPRHGSHLHSHRQNVPSLIRRAR
jgi:hypothetical protein